MQHIESIFSNFTPPSQILASINPFKANPNELNPRHYLETLDPVDRRHVECVVGLVESFRFSLPVDSGAIVNAVGSTVRPPHMRWHDPKDIDLILLAGRKSPHDGEIFWDLNEDLQKYLTKNFSGEGQVQGLLSYEQYSYTLKNEIVNRSGNTPVLCLDRYNEDPSFDLFWDEGLPTHISIPRIHEATLGDYMQHERTTRGYISTLYG